MPNKDDRHDRRPRASRSPFELRLEGKRLQVTNVRIEQIMKCDDPNCPTCRGKSSPGGSVTPNTIRASILESLLRSGPFSSSFEATSFNASAENAKGEAAAPSHPAREKAKREEGELRPAVERFFLKATHHVGWDDIVGNEDARAALLEAIVHPVRHKDVYAFYGVRPSKGVLLYGPPGCGKTMFGKAAATALAQLHGKQSEIPTLLHINGPEIQSPYVGVTENTIRTIFAYARAYKVLHGMPLVIFIDEADSILPSRSGSNGRTSTAWEESQVATFLTEMDGLEDSGAFVVLATNRPNSIDEAVLRDGRCDRKIKVKRPDQNAATAIIRKAIDTVPLALEKGATRSMLAEATVEVLFDPLRRLFRVGHKHGPDFLTMGDIVNGAMLVSLVEQAKSHAFRRDIAAYNGTHSGVTLDDFVAAIDSVTTQNRVLSHTDALQELADRIEGPIWSVTPVGAETGQSAVAPHD